MPQVTWPGEALLGNNDTNNAGRILKIVTWQLLAHPFAIPLQLRNPRESSASAKQNVRHVL